MAEKKYTYLNVFGHVHCVEGDRLSVGSAITAAGKKKVPVHFKDFDGTDVWVNPEAVGSVWE